MTTRSKRTGSKKDAIIRSEVRAAIRAEKAGRPIVAAFILGGVWSHMTSRTDPEVQGMADDLRARLGITGDQVLRAHA